MPRNQPTGPLPTIAHDKAHGNAGILVFCQANFGRCGHMGRVSWGRLDLPDDVPVIHIDRHRTFVCTRCGVRSEVDVRPDHHRQVGEPSVSTWGMTPPSPDNEKGPAPR